MSKSCLDTFFKAVVYFAAISHLIGGAYQISTAVKFLNNRQMFSQRFSQDSKTYGAVEAIKAVAGVISIVLGFILFLGAVKRKRTLVLVYLVIMMVILCMSCIGALLLAFKIGRDAMMLIVYHLFSLTLVGMTLYCVYRFYKGLVSRDNQRKREAAEIPTNY